MLRLKKYNSSVTMKVFKMTIMKIEKYAVLLNATILIFAGVNDARNEREREEINPRYKSEIKLQVNRRST